MDGFYSHHFNAFISSIQSQQNFERKLQVGTIVKNSGCLFDNVCTSPIVSRREDMENDKYFAKLSVNSPANSGVAVESNLDRSVESVSVDLSHNHGSPIVFSVSSPIGINDNINDATDEESEHIHIENDSGINTPSDRLSDSNNEVENDDERMARELAESEALARQLMAEEAMASYAMSQEFLRSNADQFSSEDLAALQAAIEEEDPNASIDEEDEEEVSQELSYDTLLRLGERIGDVKTERWAMRAQTEIQKLPIFIYEGHDKIVEHNDSTSKCLVCQEKYVEGDDLRLLPCKHCFHIECVDQWLSAKDCCPYCRQTIISE